MDVSKFRPTRDLFEEECIYIQVSNAQRLIHPELKLTIVKLENSKPKLLILNKIFRFGIAVCQGMRGLRIHRPVREDLMVPLDSYVIFINITFLPKLDVLQNVDILIEFDEKILSSKYDE